MNVKGMTFDQVERYRAAGLVLNAVRSVLDVERLKVLDLGGYFETLDNEVLLPLPALHPELVTVVADLPACDLPGYHVLEPGETLPFADDEFHVTLCMDVLEHIHPDHRPGFLDEIFRVASGMVIVAAPFYNPLREASDRWLAEYLDGVLGTPNPMLQEHLANGLPDATNFEAFLEKHGMRFTRFSNGDLKAWHLVMALKHLLLLSSGKDACMRFETETLRWASPVNIEEPGYRDIYVAVKSSESSSCANGDGRQASDNLSLSLTSVEEAVKAYEKTLRNRLRDRTGDSLAVICSHHMQSVGESIREFRSTVNDNRRSLDNMLREKMRLERGLKLVQLQLERSAEHIRKIDLTVREKNVVIDQLLSREKRKAQEVARHIREYEKGLHALQTSMAYRTGRILLAPLKAAARLIKKQGQVPKTVQKEVPEKEEQKEGQVPKTMSPDPRLKTLSHKITFSLLVPVYDTEPRILREMIESVQENFP